jgi:hypothetical protein
LPGSKAGINTSDSFTVENAVRDWLTKGTKGLSDKTISDYKSLADSNLIPFIGAHKLKALTADNKSKHWCRINLLHAMHAMHAGFV